MLAQFKPGQAYQHIERAQNLERLGRLDEAMLEFKRAVEADPSIAAARNALGQHYLRKGLATKAADEFHTAVLLNPGYESCFNLGRALTELEHYAEAADAFGRCLSLAGNGPSARYELACVQCAQGQFSEALAQLQLLAEQYPEDWELKMAEADCYIGLGEYAAAVGALQEALQNAPPNADTTAIHKSLQLARRHQEFPAQQPLELKDRLYVNYGIICLGSGRDDGLDVPVYEDHTLTYRDVATTLRRLLALVRELGWQFNVLISVDKDSAPLTIALSELLEVPLLDVAQLREEDLVLVVQALGTQRELCEVTLEHVPGPLLSFTLAAPGPLNKRPLADVVGIRYYGKCILPWKRIRKRSSDAAATSILRALAIVPIEDNLHEQISYYTQEHRLLRFLDLPAGHVHRRQ